MKAIPLNTNWNDENEFDRDFIDLNETYLPPTSIIYTMQGEDKTRLFTLGNLSMVKGKAKSKKTFIVSLFTSLLLGEINDHEDILYANDKYKGVLHFDTEQSPEDVANVGLRQKKIHKTIPSIYYVISSRKHDTAKRMECLRYWLDKKRGKFSLLVIDGIADLVADINDRAECVKIINELMLISTEHNIHIMSVLHENKGSIDARGHLGTELTNKCETVIRLSNDKGFTKVEGEYTRGRGFDPWQLQIDSEGLPFLSPMVHCEPKNRFKKADPSDFELIEHMNILNSSFKEDEVYTPSDFVEKIEYIYNKAYHNRKSLSRDTKTTFKRFLIEESFFEPTEKHLNSSKMKYRFIANNKKINGFNYDTHTIKQTYTGKSTVDVV